MNVSNYKPADNKFEYLDGSPQLEEGKSELEDYMIAYPPEIIITLGEYALRIICEKYNIYQWRGSPLLYKNFDVSTFGIKVLPTHHPSTLLHSKDLYSIFSFDLQKALDYQNNKLKVNTDNFTIVSDPLEQRNYFNEILSSPYVTIDIETKRNSTLDILCVGFGLSNSRAICFTCQSFSSLEILRELIPQISKPIYHNGLFDISVLRYFHNIPAKPAYFDTMVAQHILEPELPKGLDFLCSTLTSRPCYWAGIKFDEENKSWSEKRAVGELYTYNCLDCVVTYESFENQRRDFAGDRAKLKKIFDYEMEMLEVAMHISSTGFCVDQERKNLLLSSLETKKKIDYTFLCALAGKHVLITSPKQVKEFLYDDLGLPARRNRDGSITTGEDALVNLVGYCKGEISKLKTKEAKMKWEKNVAILKIILNIRKYEKLISSYVGAEFSADGRMRGVYKVTGTETGRWAGGNWLDQTGLNMQTLPRESVEI